MVQTGDPTGKYHIVLKYPILKKKSMLKKKTKKKTFIDVLSFSGALLVVVGF